MPRLETNASEIGPPCAVCGEPLNYIPKPCCNQYDCPCQGRLEPEQTVCSEECFMELTKEPDDA